jgi:hypothetical protein
MTTDTSSRTFRFLPIEIVTAGYRVAGKVMVSNTGAIGLLNDPTHSLIEVHDAYLARLQLIGASADHFELLRLLKSQLYAACFARREDLGPQALVRGGYSNMIEYPVRIAMQILEVEAILESTGRLDFATLVTEGAPEFIALFNGTITGLLNPGLHIQSGGMLINRRQIDLVALLNQRAKMPKQ